MNRKYEVLLLIDPTLDKETFSTLIKNVETKLGGSIIKKEEWGKKTLEYEIKKHKEAIYVLYYVETEPENIKLLKDMIAITKNILRPMILVHEKKWPYEYKTAKELKFPERKPRKDFQKRTFNSRPEETGK